MHRIAHCCSCCVHVVEQLPGRRERTGGRRRARGRCPWIRRRARPRPPHSVVPASSVGPVGPVGSATTSSGRARRGRVPFGESALVARLASTGRLPGWKRSKSSAHATAAPERKPMPRERRAKLGPPSSFPPMPTHAGATIRAAFGAVVSRFRERTNSVAPAAAPTMPIARADVGDGLLGLSGGDLVGPSRAEHGPPAQALCRSSYVTSEPWHQGRERRDPRGPHAPGDEGQRSQRQCRPPCVSTGGAAAVGDPGASVFSPDCASIVSDVLAPAASVTLRGDVRVARSDDDDGRRARDLRAPVPSHAARRDLFAADGHARRVRRVLDGQETNPSLRLERGPLPVVAES